MDQRGSLLSGIYRIDGEPSDEQIARVAGDKSLIFEGLLRAVAAGIDPATVGVLVDEQFGAAVAARARATGIDLAMPIERSGQKTFTLEFGDFDDDEWLRHIEAFAPNQVKVLVRDNPAIDAADRQLQFERLARVSAAVGSSERAFLIELLVPAAPEQLASVSDDLERYDREVRPALTVRVIHEMQDAGVEPRLWKIEGLETREAATQVAAAATRDGRDGVGCIVLGRDAPQHRLDHWLDVAASVAQFRGFAIGRSIWKQPLIDHLAGAESREGLVARVASNFTHFVDRYTRAG